MVFEHLYKPEFLKRKPYIAFLLGIAYSIFGIGISLMIYPQDPALLSVAITTLLFLPSLQNLVHVDGVQKKDGLNVIRLITNNRPMMLVYTFAFLGMLLTFAFFAITLPSLATNVIFKAQLSVLADASTAIGQAIFTSGLFWDILLNNIKVLIFAFLISLFAGNGSMLIIAWNASVWGTIFGTLAKTSASMGGADPWIFFALIMISVIPHTLLEMLSYVVATISGSTISEGVIHNKLSSQRFLDIFMRNLALMIIALAILVLAVVVETYVLDNFETYRKIIEISFG